MKFRIAVTRLAKLDLDDLIIHIGEDNPRAAVDVAAKILARIDLLRAQPELGRRGRRPGTRELVIDGTRYISLRSAAHARLIARPLSRRGEAKMVRPYCRELSYVVVRATAFVLALVVASSCRRASAGSRQEQAPERGTAGSPSSPPPAGKETITFPSGELTLHGVVYKPAGPGVHPAILWNHGSYQDPMVAFDELGPVFASRGWIFFGPFRRGQGLSASAGPYIDDELDRAGKQGGIRAKARTMVDLLTGDHLGDQLAAYAWLKQQPFVAPNRIAVGGNSFGGIETVLGAERVPYCAAIDGAGAAQSWALAPELHDVMVRAARASRAPMFLFQAENDFDLAPSRTLGAAMLEAGKIAEVKIYPPFGGSRGEGHNFAWHGSAIWAKDVFAFLERHCAE